MYKFNTSIIKYAQPNCKNYTNITICYKKHVVTSNLKKQIVFIYIGSEIR